MKQLDSTHRIATLFSRFVSEVKGLNTINQYGINIISENILIPIFKEIFDYQDLINLNSEKKNFEGIDLGDKKKKVAFQITSSSTNSKILHTLKQFIQNEHYKIYNTLYIYIITEKADFYSEKEYSKIISGKFLFSAGSNIIDFRDLIRLINGIVDFKKIKRIEDILEEQFSEKKLNEYQTNFNKKNNEIVTTNLLEINFPDRLYVAKLNLDRNDVLSSMKNKRANDRQVIYHYKSQNGLRFSADWIDFNKQIYTFHDLWNKNHDLSKIIDLGTIDVIDPKDFYEQDQNCLRVFKALLKYCFSKQAYFLGIDFYHEDNIYVFIPQDEDLITRTEYWDTGKRKISRDVIRVKLNKRDNTPWYYTNLAFSIIFRIYDDKWYLEISPDWYITKDGKQKHIWMHEDVVSFLKRRERNQHVLNHLRFIGNFLKSGKTQIGLFDEDHPIPRNFIEYKNFLKFHNSQELLENDWTTKENEFELKEMKDSIGLLEFEI